MALINLTSIDADEHPLKINNSLEFRCLAEIEADKAIHHVVIESSSFFCIIVHCFLLFYFNIELLGCAECSCEQIKYTDRLP